LVDLNASPVGEVQPEQTINKKSRKASANTVNFLRYILMVIDFLVNKSNFTELCRTPFQKQML
jgi:hypothetical protein